MARLRSNNQQGILGAALTASTTGVTFGSVPSFATLTAPDYYTIVLDPGTISEEIVRLTAYTAGTATGTILRGQEGSAPSAHISTASWLHGPTAADFLPAAAVFNVREYGAKGDGVTDDTAAIQAAITAAGSNGTVLFPPATYVVTAALPLNTGVTYWGPGATITAAVAGLTAFLSQVYTSGTLHDVRVYGLTFLGGSSSGTVIGISVDSSAFDSATAYYDIRIEDCTFRQCRYGMRHVGNNTAIAQKVTNLTVTRCRFDSCGWGFAFGGTYGDWVDHCYFAYNTQAAVVTCSAGYQGWSNPPAAGAGPPTIFKMTGCNVEGNQDPVNGTDFGIDVQCSNSQFADNYVAYVSQLSVYIKIAENNLANIITNLSIWGGGGGLTLDAPNGNTAGVVTGFKVEGSGWKTNWSSWTDRQMPIYILSGSWSLSRGTVTTPADEGFGTRPLAPYAVALNGNTPGRAYFDDVKFSTFGTGLFITRGTARPEFNLCGGVTPKATFDAGNPTTSMTTAQHAFGYNGMPQYLQFIATQHNAAPAGNQVRVYTSDGTLDGSFPANAILGLTVENGHTCSPQTAAAQALATGGTVTTAGPEVQRVAPAAAVTGVILQAGTVAGQRCTVVNESAAALSVTFAAAGSNVADGLGSPIAGLTARSFVWDSGTSLWYRAA